MMKKEVMNNSATQPFIKLISAPVVSNIEIAPSVYILAFKRNFQFKSGQVLGIGLHPNDDVRLYSIFSGEHDDNIFILYKVKPDGKLTPPLSSVQAGQPIFISPPFGSYLGSREPAYWIANGTGIAPFHSMYRSGFGDNKILVHGERTLDLFYDQQELKSYFGDRYIRCASQEIAEGIFHGRVTDFLISQKQLPLNYNYYLCGSAEMVVDCREILLQKGISFNNIKAEIFF